MNSIILKIKRSDGLEKFFSIFLNLFRLCPQYDIHPLPHIIWGANYMHPLSLGSTHGKDPFYIRKKMVSC